MSGRRRVELLQIGDGTGVLLRPREYASSPARSPVAARSRTARSWRNVSSETVATFVGAVIDIWERMP